MGRVGVAFLAIAALGVLGIRAGSAADLDVPVKGSPPPAPPFSWTGFYLGGNIGAGWGTSDTTLLVDPSLGFGVTGSFPFGTLSPSGILGGVQVGYNWQIDWIVLGIEGDFDGAAIKTTNSGCGNPFFGQASLACSTNTDWLASVSGRVGGVVGDRFLAYVKGGAAWKDTKYSASETDTFDVLLPPGVTASSSAVRLGALLGFGLEYAFAAHWTGFIEYDYMDFGSQTVAFTATGLTANASITDKLSVIKTGVSYKF